MQIQLGEHTDTWIEGRTPVTDGYKVNETFIWSYFKHFQRTSNCYIYNSIQVQLSFIFKEYKILSYYFYLYCKAMPHVEVLQGKKT